MTLYLLLFIFKVVYSYISVLGPDELKNNFKDGNIQVSYSNFGKIPFGFNLVGRLHWDPNNTDVDMACKPINSSSISPLEIEVDQSPILMIDRGNCSFVTKVRNVENAGGKVALIVNNDDMNISRIIMSDDGTGRDITIPALLVSKKDGQILKDFYSKNQNDVVTLNKISLNMNFDTEVNSTVEMKLFLSSEMLEVYDLLEEFYHYKSKLDKLLKFTPFYAMKEDDFYDPLTPKSISNCVSGGLYCANKVKDLNITDPINIINENIRQKCIFNNYNPDIYFQYMINFHKECMNKTIRLMFNSTCSDIVFSILKIDSEKIKTCIASSFNDYSNFRISSNTLLEQDAIERKSVGAFVLPSIMINNRRFSGSLKGTNVFEGVCAGFLKKPDICFDEGEFMRPPKTPMSWGTIIFVVVLAMIGNLLIYLLCRRYISKKIMERLETTDINHRINTVVTSYLALKENK